MDKILKEAKLMNITTLREKVSSKTGMVQVGNSESPTHIFAPYSYLKDNSVIEKINLPTTNGIREFKDNLTKDSESTLLKINGEVSHALLTTELYLAITK